MRIGASTLHGTHTLREHRGVWWCTKCGRWTGGVHKSTPKGLLRACGTRSRGGRNVLLRLARGLTPKKTVVWPLPEGDSTLLDWRTVAALPTRRLHCKTTLTLQHFSVDLDSAELDGLS